MGPKEREKMTETRKRKVTPRQSRSQHYLDRKSECASAREAFRRGKALDIWELERHSVSESAITCIPAIERPWDFPLGFCEFTIPSQIRARVIPTVPKRRGLRRPTRSRIKTMKMKSTEVVSRDWKVDVPELVGHLGGRGFECRTSGETFKRGEN